VSGASDVFLGLIALAAVVIAGVQVGLIVVAVRLVNRVDALSMQFDREIAPLAEKLRRVADHLQHATGLAAVQIERLDRLFAGASKRADETMSLVQSAVVGPIREGLAVVAALRGVIGAVRAFRRGGPSRAPAKFDDEDPLFIG
jgi:two-component sensor histidine kinase